MSSETIVILKGDGLREFVESRMFTVFVTAVIIINSITLGLETSPAVVSRIGPLLHVIDTAGLRKSDDPVEQEGIRRAWQEIEKADVVLLLIDATHADQDYPSSIESRLQNMQVKRLYTKSDLLETLQTPDLDGQLISTKTGQGMDVLIDDLTRNYQDFNHNESSFIARKRHVEALKQSLVHVQNAVDIFQHSASGELMAEDLRHAQNSLGEITGEFTSEDLLGRIFSSFCIGK